MKHIVDRPTANINFIVFFLIENQCITFINSNIYIGYWPLVQYIWKKQWFERSAEWEWRKVLEEAQ